MDPFINIAKVQLSPTSFGLDDDTLTTVLPTSNGTSIVQTSIIVSTWAAMASFEFRVVVLVVVLIVPNHHP